MAQRGHAQDCPGCEWDAWCLLPEDAVWTGSSPEHRRQEPPVYDEDRWWRRASQAEHERLWWEWCADQLQIWWDRYAVGESWPCPKCGRERCAEGHTAGLRVALAGRRGYGLRTPENGPSTARRQ